MMGELSSSKIRSIAQLTNDWIVYFLQSIESSRCSILCSSLMQQPLWLAKFQSSSLRWAIGLAIALGWASAARSQPGADSSTLDICKIDLSVLKSGGLSTDSNIITADTVSAKGTTIPSLWWTNEEFSPKLVTNWIADRRQNQIYLLVNTQYWNTLDYLDRYRAIDRFGRVAQGYGYNLKVCNSQKIQIGSYACTLAAPPSGARSAPQSSCQVLLDNFGQTGLGVNK
jgi:hypothetical protein